MKTSRHIFFLILLCLVQRICLAQTQESGALNLDAPALEAKAPEKAKSVWDRITPSLDTRILLLLREKPVTAGREGLAVMQANLGFDFELSSDLSAITRYNLGFLGTGPRELYLDFHPAWINSLKVGRFPLEFAFRLSDHRIYTKRFFGVSINDFETGVQATHSWGNLRLSLGLVQGLGSGEAFQTNEILLTPTFDLRYDFEVADFSNTVGVSAFRTFRLEGSPKNTDNSTAMSLFLRSGWQRISLLGEFVYGHRRNALKQQEIGSFTSSAAYAGSLATADSLGVLAQLELRILNSLKSFYEYNQVAFDARYQADRFQKHALGLKWAFHEQADVELRYEKSLEGRELDPDLRINNDAVLITLHAWF